MRLTKLRALVFAIILCLVSGILPTSGFDFGPTTAEACPNCKVANESDDRKPRAYMYSILFMLAMPAVVFTGFSLGFYRMVKKAERMQAEQDAALGDNSDDPSSTAD